MLLIGAALVASGVTIAVVPFHTDISYVAPGVGVYGTSDCGLPVRAAFDRSPEPSAWFAYAPRTKAIVSNGFGCQTPARRRVALGALLVCLGAAALVIAFRLQRRELEPPTVT